ncbi:hypothetical protein M231_07094 [Tremella mesenterica]|uniref:Transmembrane protein n=1 Tax=Tremella mesenterica TaxID=5217 RepID=A0A4Q1BD13_TREME|nr:uncharacterized protein TREMEDRAFT_55788 [Tremella mesenterica DSM 1558]EIW71964.1 hypothetical protein TREMEDRAFT_55788 [Tremella mesenterica DSM 1558]RXK35664.1 hypothetical protein M231_07094 [Tremella mesenterica]
MTIPTVVITPCTPQTATPPSPNPLIPRSTTWSHYPTIPSSHSIPHQPHLSSLHQNNRETSNIDKPIDTRKQSTMNNIQSFDRSFLFPAPIPRHSRKRQKKREHSFLPFLFFALTIILVILSSAMIPSHIAQMEERSFGFGRFTRSLGNGEMEGKRAAMVALARARSEGSGLGLSRGVKKEGQDRSWRLYGRKVAEGGKKAGRRKDLFNEGDRVGLGTMELWDFH